MSSRLFTVLAAALVCGVACLPLLGGLPQGHDWFYELIRIVEFDEALHAGQFPPAWAGDLYGGYGSPFFLFYAPLFYFGSAIAYAAAGSYIEGMIFTIAAFTLLSALTIYLAGKELDIGREGDGSGARIGLYLFVLNPYLLCDKFLRNSNAEFAGLSLLPLVPYGILMIKRNPPGGLLVTSMALALVTVTHNITALSAAALAVGLALFLYFLSPSRKLVIWVTAGIALGLVMAAFFWFPAFSLLSHVRGNELLSGKFDFHNQFVDLTNIFSYNEFYSTGMLPLLVLMGVLAASAMGTKYLIRDRYLLLASLAVAGFLLFLMTRQSVVIWENVPLLPYFEFPWRLLGPFALVVALSGGMAFSRLTATRSTTVKRLLEFIVLAACISNVIPGLNMVKSIGAADWESIEELIQPSSIQRRGLKATVYTEFMPQPSDRNAWRNARGVKGPLLFVPPDLEVVVDRNDPIQIQLSITTPLEIELQLARWFFPGWKATLNGEPVQLRRSDLGSIAVAVPAGAHKFRCYFDNPPSRKYANWVSLAGLLVWLSIGFRWAGWGRTGISS